MDNHENMSDGKTSFLIGLVVFILVALAVIIFFAADVVSDALERPRSNQDIVETNQRIEPVGKVNIASNPNPDLGKVVVATAAAVEFSAKGTYEAACAACHANSALGAPVFGNAANWSARLAKGLETLYSNAINGIGAMPARGGANLTDDQVKEVIDYILENSK